MADGRERFIDIACELTGEKSPTDIRFEELSKLVIHQTIDLREFFTDPLVSDIFNDPEFWNDGEGS